MALSNIYLLQYNNYFNRKVKKLDTVAEYVAKAVHVTPNASFNPNDGVTAQHVINNGIACDYCVVTNQSDTEIESRWFVVESARTRNGQYQYTLYRDIFADYLDNIKESTCFVNKGYVPQNSPLIFNNENMGFNQIKTKEVLLKNRLDTPWIVAYLARYNNEGEYNSFTGSFKSVAYTGYDYTVNALSDYPYYSVTVSQPYFYENGTPSFQTQFKCDGKGYICTVTENAITLQEYPVSALPASTPTVDKLPSAGTSVYPFIYQAYTNGIAIDSTTGLQKNTYSYRGTQSGANTLAAENGKLIKTTDKTYRVNLNNTTFSQSTVTVPSGSTLFNTFFEYVFAGVTKTDGNYSLFINGGNLPAIYINYPIIDAYNPTYTVTYDSTVTRDAQYEILATPLNNVTFTIDKTGAQFYHDGTIALEWFQDIANRYKSSGYCYDVQIVPYVNIDNADVSTQNQVKLGNSCIAFKLTESSFTYANEVTIPMRTDKKIGNECDLYRICSPNGIGEYEFNPYKNGGFGTFEADVTLLPINPYIQIHPIWGELYGDGSIEDFRGLICGGDFSLGNTSNEWLTYQQQNKYYQAIFDRNIESQEVNNNISREREKWDVATGVLGGAVSGGTGGALVGGIPGAIAGAVIGGGASLAAGLKDMELNERSRSEAISLQKDQFGYQLGTVKARTTQLAKTTAFNVDSKYFPYVEYWTCTDEEVAALKNKIKYNGMTVGVIGKLKDFINPNGETFVQASLIEIDIMDDTHLANAIARNLSEGIRI